MKTENVKSCADCPFRYTDYDDFTIGDSTIEICVLSQNNNNDDYIITSYDDVSSDIIKDINIPVWCPLRKDDYTIKL